MDAMCHTIKINYWPLIRKLPVICVRDDAEGSCFTGTTFQLRSDIDILQSEPIKMMQWKTPTSEKMQHLRLVMRIGLRFPSSESIFSWHKNYARRYKLNMPQIKPTPWELSSCLLFIPQLFSYWITKHKGSVQIIFMSYKKQFRLHFYIML